MSSKNISPKTARIIEIFNLLLALGTINMISSFTREEDLVYGRKDGMALTLDVFRPTSKPNRKGILLIISSGWGSSQSAINTKWVEHYTAEGFTVFAVVHGSAPRYTIPEIIPDVHRAARFIRFNASKYGIDPQKLGATGASSGGHLSLMLATRGAKGPADSKDPIDRESSEIQAAAVFFPPTDFNNFVGPNVNALDESVLKNYRKVIGKIPENIEERDNLGKSISPIYWITSKTAPTLIHHGEKDWNILPHQSQSFVETCLKCGVKAKLILKKGAAHGWDGMAEDIKEQIKWFRDHQN